MNAPTRPGSSKTSAAEQKNWAFASSNPTNPPPLNPPTPNHEVRCHRKRSEGSAAHRPARIPRFALDDKSWRVHVTQPATGNSCCQSRPARGELAQDPGAPLGGELVLDV